MSLDPSEPHSADTFQQHALEARNSGQYADAQLYAVLAAAERTRELATRVRELSDTIRTTGVSIEQAMRRRA